MRNVLINHYHKKCRRPTLLSDITPDTSSLLEMIASDGDDSAETFFAQFFDEEIDDALESLPWES